MLKAIHTTKRSVSVMLFLALSALLAHGVVVIPDLLWDPDTATSGEQGGSGQWRSTSVTWWDGYENRAAEPYDALVFSATPGTVQVKSSMTNFSLRFDVADYEISVDNNKHLHLAQGLFGEGSFTKSGKGSLSIDGWGDFSGEATLERGNLIQLSADAAGTAHWVFNGNSPTLTIEADQSIDLPNTLTARNSSRVQINTTADDVLATWPEATIEGGGSLRFTAQHQADAGLLLVELAADASLETADNTGLFILGPYTDTTGAQLRPGDSDQGSGRANVFHDGIHFANGLTNSVLADVVPLNTVNSDPAFGARGQGTEVVFKGRWDGDGNNTDSFLIAQDNAVIRVEATAEIDTVMPDGSNGRTFRIRGDGTGTVIFDEGFKAYRSNSDRLQSVRVQNAIWVTRDAGNLPDFIKFDDVPGGVWRIESREPSYDGAVVVDVPATIETFVPAVLNQLVINDDLSKRGVGELRVTGGSAAPDATLNVYEGTVLFDADMPRLEVTVAEDAEFVGNGTVGLVNYSGAVRIGGDGGPASLRTSGWSSGSNAVLALTLYGPESADRLMVDGAVDLSDSSLVIRLDYAPSAGDSWTLIANDGEDPIQGHFKDLPEGTTIEATYGGQVFALSVSYIGGDGNDLTLSLPTDTATLQVISPLGSPEPPAGLHVFSIGNTMTCSLNEPVTEPAMTTQRVACVGWRLTDADGVSTGGALTVDVILTGNTTLEWLWATQVLVQATVEGTGEIEGHTGWVPVEIPVELIALPDRFSHFVAWTGEVFSTENPLRLPPGQAKQVVALFAENLTEPHEVPERWLAGHGLEGDFNALDTEDSDGDGMPNWQEYVAGTMPTNETSLLAIEETRSDPLSDTHEVRWTSVAGKSYTLLRAPVVTGPYEVVASGLTAIDDITAFQDAWPAETGRMYYRIRVER